MDELTRKCLFGLVWLTAVLAALLFGGAGTLKFWQGWLFLGLLLLCNAAVTAWFLKFDPALIARRIHAGPLAEREPRQKLIQTFTSLTFAALPLIAGIDRRFGWSSLGAVWPFIGCALIALGYVAIFVVFRANSFASSIIETSAGQKLIDTGPYALVRHPMYAGALPIIFGIPLALGSLWSFAASLAFVAGLVWRLLDEERFLRQHLAGYTDYTSRVKWRLVPGLW